MGEAAGVIWALLYLLFALVFSVGPILLFFVIGKLVERSHYRSLVRREAALKHIVVTNLKQVPSGVTATSSFLVTGDVVVAPDYFKTWWAGIKTLIGGRLGSLVTLMERARRESLLRMKEQAEAQGARFIINVRFETANLRRVSGQGNQQQGAAMVEMLCYGTAIKGSAGSEP
ncbi:MAG: heavy metal-binding domain-containing protein [Deltaproteobacteria bacterium]|nr:heavy metal-binding domain-containing protein [Deltaproteobacteria bacterium]